MNSCVHCPSLQLCHDRVLACLALLLTLAFVLPQTLLKGQSLTAMQENIGAGATVAVSEPNAPNALRASTAIMQEQDREIEKLEAEITDLKHQVQTSKNNLESQKLILEIRQLQHWWLQPSFLQAIFGSLVALAAVVTGYFNGWFEVQRGKLEVQTAKLEDKRSELNAQISAAADKGATLAANLERTLAELEREKAAREQATASLVAEKERADRISGELLVLKSTVQHVEGEVKTQVNRLSENWQGYLSASAWRDNSVGPIDVATEFHQPPFDYASNVSAETLFRASATPAMLQLYEQLSSDQKRAFEVQFVINHLETVNRLATGHLNWEKETLLATAENLS